MIDQIIDFEQGFLSEVDTIKLFSDLIKTDTIWKLQGFYGRTATDMINNGILDKQGNILINLDEIY